MKMNRVRRSPSITAFTLIELMLVLVILAVLAAVVVPKFSGKSEQARIAAAKTEISAIDNALDQFEVNAGRYPSSDEGLSALITQPSNVKSWDGPYLKRSAAPNDPWGKPYAYRFPGTHTAKTPDLWSFGPDGQDGTEDDITNWSTN